MAIKQCSRGHHSSRPLNIKRIKQGNGVIVSSDVMMESNLIMNSNKTLDEDTNMSIAEDTIMCLVVSP